MYTTIKNNFVTVFFFFFTTLTVFSQIDLDQNGLKTTVISNLVTETQPKRYEIATIGYNSFHWQSGGILIIELYQISYVTGYEKYIVENGFGQGANYGSPIVKLLESEGMRHTGKITLGNPADITTSFGGYVNKQIPVFFDVKDYSNYKVKITYLQEKVNVIDNYNQIKINQNPTAINIPDFEVSNALTNLLKISGNGNHYIQNGNLGIGTTNPDEKLTVKGKIHAQEVKVDMLGALVPDYVFANDYKLKSLEETEEFIKKNNHLPEIPSAKEIETNGLMLAEMNMSLLKKNEELTLYLIEQNRSNLYLKQKVENLEKENQDFKTLLERFCYLKNN